MYILSNFKTGIFGLVLLGNEHRLSIVCFRAQERSIHLLDVAQNQSNVDVSLQALVHVYVLTQVSVTI